MWVPRRKLGPKTKIWAPRKTLGLMTKIWVPRRTLGLMTKIWVPRRTLGLMTKIWVPTRNGPKYIYLAIYISMVHGLKGSYVVFCFLSTSCCCD